MDGRMRGPSDRAMRKAILTAGLTALLLVALPGGIAHAHGKEASLAVTCATPDPGRPLVKACTAVLRYEDGDPVEGASLVVEATRTGSGEASFTPVPFEPLGEPGVYSAVVEFPAYGTWRLRFILREPAEGEADLQEEILPPVPGASSEIRAQLRVVFSFGLADVRNLALRLTHALAALALVGSVALTLVATTFARGEDRLRLLRRWATPFPWVAGGSLLVLAVSGVLNAVYNTPTRAPGLFAPRNTTRLPFGQVYVAIFLVKMALTAGILVATAGLSLALRRSFGAPAPGISGGSGPPGPHGPERRVRRLAALDLALGLLVLAVVVVTAYFHILSHVGGTAGAT